MDNQKIDSMLASRPCPVTAYKVITCVLYNNSLFGPVISLLFSVFYVVSPSFFITSQYRMQAALLLGQNLKETDSSTHKQTNLKA